ncbi:MAG: DivIVA domain-containing protein [Solobacterium sp.]|nr:DivIVA domain-containing protein [Solobacterium sp.]
MQRPTFRVMKNGYDRFAVDDAIERYAAQTAQLEKKIELYQQQLIERETQLEELKEKYRQMVQSDENRRETADQIARVSLREANEIINTAQKNADLIIGEALASARGILEDLSRLYDQAGTVKTDAKDQLEQLLRDLDNFRLPEMPDLRWLQEAQKKLR